jgi:phospholipid/cholesterol/gamma-HCH transport system substrate-binding protein
MSDEHDKQPDKPDDRPDKGPRGDKRNEGDKKVEGYWHSITVPRDSEDLERRQERVEEASRRREAEAEALRVRGSGPIHQRLGRQLRHRGKDFAAIGLLLVVGLAVAFGIITKQKAALPSWVPFLGQDFFELDGEFSTAQAITPGQGQAVMIAGIQVGTIASVHLEDGRAVVGMNIEEKYAPVIRDDAQLLIRPKTNLMDMTIEVDPGDPDSPPMPDGGVIPESRTEPNVNPDEFLARLDQDTRQALVLLINSGAEGLGGRGQELSKPLRRIEPFTHYIAELNGALARRRAAIARAIHDFGLLTDELGRHSTEITRFVQQSAAALGGFADEQDAIRAALQQLPPTLETTRGALDEANTLSSALRPTLTALIPQAEALQPGLAATTELFENTTPTLRDQLRPFTGQVAPVVKHTEQLSKPLPKTVNQFGNSLEALNYGFNELAFNPGVKNPGFLFYLPWLNHDLNATWSLQDGNGPIRRGMVMLSCNSTDLAGGFVLTRPFLNTIYQATNIPTRDEIC